MLLPILVLLAAEPLRDIEFARPGGVALTLDASIPDGPGPHPAVIIVHGGGFIRGDKQTYVPPLFPPLSAAGFAWFSINYRLAPQHQFPAPIEDLKAAMDFVLRNAKQYRVDPKRIAIAGESAGGTIVAYYGATAKGRLRPRAVIDFYGVSDWEFHRDMLGQLSENALSWLGKADLKPASAISHIRKDMPPFLFIHGTADKQVPFPHSPRMCSAMREAGASCEVYVVEGGAHGVGSWEKEPTQQGYKRKMVEWLKETLR
ncbi:MAG: alpha/beta hydrolase [Bryobacter sp.]|jgi:acetyl esterase|nr:alpha/beta hydrolase [Bryobacter sp. CoA8 C33]